jgi:hypothetical protein
MFDKVWMARERREETRSGKEMVVSIWEAIRGFEQANEK